MVGENEQMKKQIITNFLISIALYTLLSIYGYFNLPAPYGIHSFWISAVIVAVLYFAFGVVKKE